MNAIVITILAMGALLALERAFIHWRSSRIVNRLLAEVRHPQRNSAKPRRALDPESKFVVRLSEEAVSCERPDGLVEQVAWSDLQRVEILTTPDGPLLPDAFWVLTGSDSGCVIPWGATGDHELLERLQRLPKFDNNAILNMASKTEQAMTLCWQKPS